MKWLIPLAVTVTLLAQDTRFGTQSRLVLVPATVTEDNWTWRLPWPVDDLSDRPDARERGERLSGWMRRYRRSSLMSDRSSDDASTPSGLQDVSRVRAEG